MTSSRRKFLNYSFKTMAAGGASGVLGRLGTMNAYAASNSDYKALVGVFLFGGNDPHNTLIPLSTQKNTYQDYSTIRGQIAIPQSDLWPISAGAGEAYGLHPKLKEIQSLFGLGKAAFLANVGNLVVPTTRQQYLGQSVKLPQSLFSHSSQQAQWQTASATDVATTGWGGRAADLLGPMNAPSQFPMIVNLGGGSQFSTGMQSNPAIIPPGGPVTLRPTPLAARTTAFNQLLSFSNGLQLVQASNTVTKRGINDAAILQLALDSTPPLQTPFPTTPLGAQLKMVAQIVAVRNALGMNRQMFFVTLGGFDTHSSQLYSHEVLLEDVSKSLSAFYVATMEMGVADSVTAFTNSEFGRTLQPSSGYGTDHAWGSHAMIVGGAVKGGQIHGTFPTLALGGPDDANSRGTMIPTASIEQYGATLAKWFGVPVDHLPRIFPTLSNFPTSDLGFMSSPVP